MKNYVGFFQKNLENNYQVQTCDLCGRKDASVKDSKSGDFVCLCLKCSNYIETLPIYSKDCIERFLIGNIL